MEFLISLFSAIVVYVTLVFYVYQFAQDNTPDIILRLKYNKRTGIYYLVVKNVGKITALNIEIKNEDLLKRFL